MNLFKQINRQQAAFFICCVLMAALIFSKFAITICMIALLAVSIFQLDFSPSLSLRFNPALKRNVNKLLSHRAYLAISLLFFIILISGIWSEDLVYLGERLRIKLPFLVLPFAFISIPSFNTRQYLSLFYFLVLLLFLTCIGVGINYLMDYEAINESIKRGKVIPTPMHHIRFSLLLSFGILAGVALIRKKFFLKFAWERYLLMFSTAYLFFFIHVLSVRSGLLVLYLAIIFLSIRFVYLTKRYLLGLGIISGLFILPFIAYKSMPSFRSKIDYVRYDLDMYVSGNTKNLSDAERLISFEAGLRIGNENPLIGVGAGDLKAEVHKIYAADYPNVSMPKMPHNQFISTYAGMGILGLIVFLFAFFYPLVYQKNYQDPLFAALHLIVCLSFMMENTLESSIGVTFYTFFLLLGLNYLDGLKGDVQT